MHKGTLLLTVILLCLSGPTNAYEASYTWENGDKFHGRWLDNEMTYGELNQADGNRYVGSFKHNLPHGKGTYFWRNGSQYTGDFVKGRREGKGKMSFTYGDASYYVGTFLNDEFNGEGLYVWKSGQKHTGTFVNRKPHGFGIRSYEDSKLIKTTFNQGLMHGRGLIIMPNGKRYLSHWENDQEVGTRIEIDKIPANKQQSYVDFDIKKYDDGSLYIGEMIVNKSWPIPRQITGLGKFIWPSGSYYEGEFKFDRFQGKGKVVTVSGEIWQGIWENNRREGPGTTQLATGEILEQNWHKGELIIANGYFDTLGSYVDNNYKKLKQYITNL